MENNTLKNYEEQIEYILSNFDFDKVYKVMKWSNWIWKNNEKSPSHYELITTAERLLNECIIGAIAEDKEIYTISTGGFKAELYEDCLSLYFIIEYWDGE